VRVKVAPRRALLATAIVPPCAVRRVYAQNVPLNNAARCSDRIRCKRLMG